MVIHEVGRIRRILRLPYGPNLAEPQNPDYTFFELAPNYQCRANKRVPSSNKMVRELETNQPIINNIPNGRHFGKFIGIFGRKIECYPRRRRRTCYQYIYVWNSQLVPLHPMDYEPVFIFTDDYVERKEVLYDFDHYHIGRASIPKTDQVYFTTKGGWHSFRLKDVHSGATRRDVRNLVDDCIWHWWDFSDNIAKLTIKEGIIDPWFLFGCDHFSGVTSIIAETLYLLGLLWNKSAQLVNSLKEALMKMTHSVASIEAIKEKNFIDIQRVATMLKMGSIMLLDSFVKYDLIRLRWIPSFLENIPEIHTKMGGQIDKILKLTAIASEMTSDGFYEVVSSAEETAKASNYMHDFHNTMDNESDFSQEKRDAD
jgi:hypothetical protein